MSQVTQSAQYDVARAGMLRGDLGQFDVDTQHVAEVACGAGRFMTAGTDAASQCKPPTSAAEVQTTGLGFAVLDTGKGDNDTALEYAIGDGVPLVKTGPGVWVITTEQVAFGDPVFVQFGSTVADRGKVRNDVSTGGSEAAQLYGARVERAVSATLALISLNHGAVAGATGAAGATGPTGPTGPTGA